jgi:outer membrane protein assembly factor BamB
MRGRTRCLVLVACLTAVAAGCDWPMFRGWFDHTGHNLVESAIGLDSVAGLEDSFRGPDESAGTVTVVRGTAYIVGTRLVAYDATGAQCTGTPKQCDPLWTATPSGAMTPQAVGSGGVFVGAGNALIAYDSNGVNNCSGSPKLCQPVWTASVPDFVRTPTVANDVVYVTSNDGALRAYDATGTTGCTGAPKVCEPMWSAATGDSIIAGASVSKGVVYVATGGGSLFAFDATGTTNCSGSPKTCAPLWSADAGVYLTLGGPAVANDTVYFGSFDHNVYAFDARGITNCSGLPKVCAPLWTANVGFAFTSAPAVTGSTLYVTAHDHNLYAFDANGVSGCAGDPKTCTPLWSARFAPPGFPNCSGRCTLGFSPFVSNGLVFTGSDDGNIYAFDAGGTVNCTGTPNQCQPVWMTTGTGDPIIANGRLYISKTDLRTHVYEVSPSDL